MKIQKYISMMFVLAILLVSACNNDDPEGVSFQDEAFESLAGEWTFGIDGSIVVDGTDVSANYPGFSLSFADGTYQTSNGADLFNASGTWGWTDEQARTIRLDGNGLDITIQTLTVNRFVFSFSFAGATRAGIAGNYTVTVNK
ncbi:hypothetical protein BFP97_01775 [Roseivirga sp. 4D4]|uniref:hypothetical protein n=1 Tax=Roseivirga sp. 4D4 TaxID=1889784 RepID=UPI0008539034|nr:hypothetical protein [Roseivirga sp. 4D4]OEK00318.1 hypothetical protein BFP97_01775 [Roseivirga sp. 4D4]